MGNYKLSLSEINQSLFVFILDIILRKLSLKVFKLEFRSEKMHMIYIKRCTSFGVNDVHLLI